MLLSFFSGNQSFRISRLNESFVEQEVAILFPVHCNQPEISVYDWEADGTIGTLLISVKTSFSNGVSNESCGTVNTVATRATQHTIPGMCHVCTTSLCTYVHKSASKNGDMYRLCGSSNVCEPCTPKRLIAASLEQLDPDFGYKKLVV